MLQNLINDLKDLTKINNNEFILNNGYLDFTQVMYDALKIHVC